MARLQTDLAEILETIDRRPRLGLAAAAGLGAAMALGLAPFDLPLVTVLALALALRLAARTPTRGHCARFGWTLGTGYFLVSLQWIVEPFMVDAARHGWMAPFALVLMGGGLALFWGVAFWAAWAAGPSDGPRRGLAIVLALTGAEMLRSVIFTGFPWALIGSVWVNHPMGQLAALGGVHGLTFLTGVLAVGVLTMSVWKASRRAILASGITVLAWAGGTFLGERMIAAYDAAGHPPGPLVRMVQPNEEQAIKWLPEMIPVFWDRKLALTAAPGPGGQRPDVIVWPEVSLPFLLGSDPFALDALADAAQGAILIAGAQRWEGRELRNSAAVIGAGGDILAIYDKHHLVPFGEYFPGGALARRLGLEGLATDYLGGFSPGPGPQLLDLGPAGPVLPLICYEAIFPRHAQVPGGKRPGWIVQVTNDAWFGQFAGPQQHLDQARMRAIEQGLPLVRAANTGISAIIDPKGREVIRIRLGDAGKADAALPGPAARTLYAWLGNWPLGVVLFLLTVWVARHAGRPRT